jgi:hypothetical protein
MAETANYVFLPWVRQGAASGIKVVDGTPNQPGVVSVSVKVHINNLPEPVGQTVRLYGPGDVTGIDQQQIVRTEPRHLSFDFEPNYFPAIEFDRPDFPWLLTPASASTAGTLRPWICLVVVKKHNGVTLQTGGNQTLPRLEIKTPAKPDDELPDLSESWAWAHAQVAGSSPDTSALQKSLAGDPALTVSRLLCPRRLDPLTHYIACVVPAFELGRKAGLGQPIQRDEEKELKPAWERGASLVLLPVYYHWEFRTGTSGDFEALVGLLKPADLRDIPNLGKRQMDIGRAFGSKQVVPAGTTLELEGALRILDSPTADWPDTVKTPFQTELKKVLDEPWLITQQDSDGKDPEVAPPIYGCWQAARHIVNITAAPSASLTWLDELNLDPRHRAVAALGTQVVQTQQEQLMASAWEQLGEIERINQIRRQAQLSRTVNTVFYTKHFQRFSPETLLKITASAQGRVVVDIPNTKRALLSTRISNSAMPDRAISAPLRRLASPRNTINTRFKSDVVRPITILARLNTFTPVTAFQMREVGLVKLDDPASQAGPQGSRLNDLVRFARVAPGLGAAPKLGSDFTIAPEGTIRTLPNFGQGATDNGRTAAAFRAAANDLHSHLLQKVFPPPKPAALAAMNLAEIGASLLKSINPETTIKARVDASLVLASDTKKTDDPLEPIMDEPKFPQPMYEALRDLSQDFLFPGLEHVPPNTVALLQPNPKFVESFLVGLSTEMGRELLWRNYPTDQRGTYFQQFWDTVDEDKVDIARITDWGNRKLGENSATTGDTLVLLIRGELLRRYPNTVIYAAPAILQNNKLTLSPNASEERHPLFRGTLKPDVTFIGFTLTQAEALGEPPHKPEGWFFVIQQQPTEPRFGMDEAKFDGAALSKPATWSDLSWRHLANTEQELQQLSHATLNSIKKQFPNIDKEKIDHASWGRNSAHQAYITLQRPVRIAIHASDIIKH